MRIISTDVLVLGAGLAGLRAAWAAKEEAPDLDVLVVYRKAGPSGSSFANRNNMLGMQVPLTDDDKSSFSEEATTLAAPGIINSDLLHIMANEAKDRFEELRDLGLKFRTDLLGDPRPYLGCGSTNPRSYIFDNLTHAFNQLFLKTHGCDCEFFTNTEALGLHSHDGKIGGAWCTDRSGTQLFIRAKAVIMALGGPSTLYEHKVCGPGTGFGFAMLDKVGAELKNTAFLQFMWHDRKGNFHNPGHLISDHTSILCPDGAIVQTADFSESAIIERKRHCPVFHGPERNLIDRTLLENRFDDGFVKVDRNGTIIELAPMAHACNGGAVIDKNGTTTVPGLYAAGECATGMHGANRLGGAMVLATQVFGRRAGIAAARHARDQEHCDYNIEPLPGTKFSTEYAENLANIRKGMSEHANFLPSRKIDSFTNDLKELYESSPCHRSRLCARTAMIIAHALDKVYNS